MQPHDGFAAWSHPFVTLCGRLRRWWRAWRWMHGKRHKEIVRHIAQMEEREATLAARTPNPRVVVNVLEGSPEARYFKRLLDAMYVRWEGTLDHECGQHRLCFFSPFDEKGRRHTSFADVQIDGEHSDDRVRSYVLGPYLLAADYRTGRKTDDPWKVLHGDLTPLLPEEADANG